jgi:hypothetical protein
VKALIDPRMLIEIEADAVAAVYDADNPFRDSAG